LAYLVSNWALTGIRIRATAYCQFFQMVLIPEPESFRAAIGKSALQLA
jgi:hypothetical protein